MAATDVAGNKHNVTHTYSVETSRPDGRIKRGAKGAYAGDGIYNTTASGQARSGSASSGKSVTYFVLAQNDAAFPDRLRLTGQGSTRLFKVRYTVGGMNVTPRVVGGTYLTPSLGPAAYVVVKVSVKAKRAAKVGSKLTAALTLTPFRGGAPRDTVRFVTKRSKH